MARKETLSMHEYAERCSDFAIYPHAGEHDAMAINYCALGAASEAGEVAGVIAKAIRDDRFGERAMPSERRLAAIEECGDAIFFITRLLSELGSSLEEATFTNVVKLEQRFTRLAFDGDEIAQGVLRRIKVRREAKFR